MIVLDTNVVSEPTKPHAAPALLAWLDRHPVETFYLTSVSLAELLLGIEVLPAGRRKDAMTEAGQVLRKELFGPRILPFDEPAAAVYARLVSRTRAGGYTISVADGQIAAIASAHGFIVATRNRRPFEAAGLEVIDPWQT